MHARQTDGAGQRESRSDGPSPLAPRLLGAPPAGTCADHVPHSAPLSLGGPLGAQRRGGCSSRKPTRVSDMRGQRPLEGAPPRAQSLAAKPAPSSKCPRCIRSGAWTAAARGACATAARAPDCNGRGPLPRPAGAPRGRAARERRPARRHLHTGGHFCGTEQPAGAQAQGATTTQRITDKKSRARQCRAHMQRLSRACLRGPRRARAARGSRATAPSRTAATMCQGSVPPPGEATGAEALFGQLKWDNRCVPWGGAGVCGARVALQRLL